MTRFNVGRALVLLVAGLLLLDGVVQFLSPAMLIEQVIHIGFAPDSGPRIALITFACVLLLVIPKVAPLGGLLATAFLGGAVCAHFRIGDIGSPPQIVCVVLGIVMWIGLVLADRRLSAFLPAPASIGERAVA